MNDTNRPSSTEVADQVAELAEETAKATTRVVNEAAKGAPGLGDDPDAQIETVTEEIAAGSYMAGQDTASAFGSIVALLDEFRALQTKQLEYFFTDGGRLIDELVRARDPLSAAECFVAHQHRRAAHVLEGWQTALERQAEIQRRLVHNAAARWTDVARLVKRDWSEERSWQGTPR